MREDIYGGLKNALERGIPLERAIQSFINAGYHEQDIREAARALDTSVLSMIKPLSPQTSSPQSPRTLPMQLQKPISFSQQNRPLVPASFELRPSKSGPNWLIMILSFILLLSVVAFVVSLLFKQQIAEYISSFLG